MNRLERMNEKSVNTALFWLSAPAVVGLLIQTLYGIVDSIFVGHGLGEFGILGLSALTVAFPVSHLLLSVASGVAVGGSSYISRRMGSKDKANVKKGIGNMIAQVGNFEVSRSEIVAPLRNAVRFIDYNHADVEKLDAF